MRRGEPVLPVEPGRARSVEIAWRTIQGVGVRTESLSPCQAGEETTDSRDSRHLGQGLWARLIAGARNAARPRAAVTHSTHPRITQEPETMCDYCGERRYCSVNCQQGDWIVGKHSKKCIGEFARGLEKREGEKTYMTPLGRAHVGEWPQGYKDS